MGLELPAELTEPLSWIGMDWPQADEELLFAAGQQWLSFGMTLQAAAERANGAAEAVGRYNTGDTVDAFEAWWQREDGPQPPETLRNFFKLSSAAVHSRRPGRPT